MVKGLVVRISGICLFVTIIFLLASLFLAGSVGAEETESVSAAQPCPTQSSGGSCESGPTNTPTNTTVPQPTNTSTNTPIPSPTNTSTNTPVPSATNTPTNTPVTTATNTPTNTPPVSRTSTSTPTPTSAPPTNVMLTTIGDQADITISLITAVFIFGGLGVCGFAVYRRRNNWSR